MNPNIESMLSEILSLLKDIHAKTCGEEKEEGEGFDDMMMEGGEEQE